MKLTASQSRNTALQCSLVHETICVIVTLDIIIRKCNESSSEIIIVVLGLLVSKDYMVWSGGPHKNLRWNI